MVLGIEFSTYHVYHPTMVWRAGPTKGIGMDPLKLPSHGSGILPSPCVLWVVILMEEQSISNSLEVALERAKFWSTSAVPWITKHSVSTLITFGIVRHRSGWIW